MSWPPPFPLKPSLSTEAKIKEPRIEEGPRRGPSSRPKVDFLEVHPRSAAAARHGRYFFLLFDDQRLGGEEQTGD